MKALLSTIVLLQCLGATAADLIFSQTHLVGSRLGTTYTYQIPVADPTDTFRITVINADGQAHLKQVCTGNILQKVICFANNLITTAYITLYRVDGASISINGVPLSTANLLGKSVVQFQTPIPLKTQNMVTIKAIGPATSYLQVFIERMGVTQAPVPLSLSNLQWPQTPTYLKSLPTNVLVSFDTDKPMQSATLNQVPMRITNGGLHADLDLSLTQAGASELHIEVISPQGVKTIANSFINIILDTTSPELTINQGPIYTTQSLLQIPVDTFDANPVFTEIYLDDSKIFGSGASTFNVAISLFADGNHIVRAKATDAAGNITEKTLNIIRDTLPLVLKITSPPNNTVIRPGVFEVRFEASRPLTVATINSVDANLASDQRSGSLSAEYLAEGPYTVTLIATDQFGVTVTQIVKFVFQYDQTPVWTYQECPAN